MIVKRTKQTVAMQSRFNIHINQLVFAINMQSATYNVIRRCLSEYMFIMKFCKVLFLNYDFFIRQKTSIEYY